MKSKKLIVFDLDGVLVDIDSSWQTIHRAFGVNNEDNFQKYLCGEIDYREFMRSDIRLWRGANFEDIKRILYDVKLMMGAKETITRLRELGYRIAIISSGISILADRIREELKLDYSFANKLMFKKDGSLTGEGEEVVNLLSKGKLLKELASIENLSMGQCVAVGDSKFDVSLLREAGFGIAFNARDDLVKTVADVVIEGKDLRRILPVILEIENTVMVDMLISCNNEKEAKAIAGAIMPDNIDLPLGLTIKTRIEEKTVNIIIYCNRGLKTLISTLNDLLSCLQTANNAVEILKMRYNTRINSKKTAIYD